MSTVTVSDLALAAENEFAFLRSLGFELVKRWEFAPESYRGGFEFVFQNSSGQRVILLYGDCEFEVHTNGDEIFGASNHDPFAGNMFSHQHLLPVLPKLRAAIEPALRSFASLAT
jgi:hypothetical protein